MAKYAHEERTTQSTAPAERGCPLTCGAPISMTRAAFDKCCAARKVAAQEEAEIIDRNRASSGRVQVHFKNPCLTCQGPPALLTFIEVPTHGGDMATKRSIGECGVCGEKKNVAHRTTGIICPTCENMQTYVRKRAKETLTMLRKLAPELLETAGVDAAAVPDESKNLERIADMEAEVLGYKRQVKGLQQLLTDRMKEVEELQAELSKDVGARRAVAAHAEHSQAALKDLALRIAYGLLDGNGVDVSVKDVELLMTVQ
jgi:hypothetical protein